MQSSAIQNLVKRIFSSEETKSQFISDPESVLAHYSLSKQEKQAVLNSVACVGTGSSSANALIAKTDPLNYWY